jgi:hypothetical protein
VPPALGSEFAAHALQFVAPGATLTVPGGHAAHTDASASDARYVPGSHGSHAPPTAARPGEHRQSVSAREPPCAVVEPAGQSLHACMPRRGL